MCISVYCNTVYWCSLTIPLLSQCVSVFIVTLCIGVHRLYLYCHNVYQCCQSGVGGAGNRKGATYIGPVLQVVVPLVDGFPQQVLQLQLCMGLLQSIKLGHLHLNAHNRRTCQHTVTECHALSTHQHTVAECLGSQTRKQTQTPVNPCAFFTMPLIHTRIQTAV